MAIACGVQMHRHIQSCARCGVSDLTVSVTVVLDGAPWPPLCSECAARVRRSEKARRIAALERAVEAAS